MEFEIQNYREKLTEFDPSKAEVLKILDGHSSSVKLIEVNGSKYIFKTAGSEDIHNEKDFLETLGANGLPTLQVYENPYIGDNQLLLEYIENSTGIQWENPSEVEKWGAAVRDMHNILFDDPFKITAENDKVTLKWSEHLKNVLNKAISDQMEDENGLDPVLLEKINNYAYPRLDIESSKISLIHGDLHDGNTLMKNGEVILYDKSSELFAGDPLYDLTIIMTHFPNGVYVETSKPSNAKDQELLAAFVNGYGENFIDTQKEKLDLYLLIRALDRYPNPFEVFNKQIIENIVER